MNMNGRRGRQFWRGGGGGGPKYPRRYADEAVVEDQLGVGGGGGGGPVDGEDRDVRGPRGGNGGQLSRRFTDLTKSFQDARADIDEIKDMFSKITTELDQVKSRVRELESTGAAGGDQHHRGSDSRKSNHQSSNRHHNNQQQQPQQQNQTSSKEADDESTEKDNTTTNNKRNKPKFQRQRERRAAKLAEKRTAHSESASQNGRQEADDELTEKDERNIKPKLHKQRERRAEKSASSQNGRPVRENGNGSNYRKPKRFPKRLRVFPELTEAEMNDTVQTWKREFLTSERPAATLKKEMNAKGPKVVYEFAVSILDHAICDVTSPTKLSEIASSLYQLLVSEDNMSEVDFQRSFYEALKDISKREDDIAIDAPRYMDTLGQLLADCVVPMFGKHKNVVRKFLNRCIEAYCPQNRAVLLASIMKAAAGIKSDRFAKEIWDIAHLSWDGLLAEGADLQEFLKSHEVVFTTRTFTPEPIAQKKTPEELEKFADDVTCAVESRCSPQAIDELAKEFEIEPQEAIESYGTLIYAIVRGCLATDSGNYKLNTEALNKYSGILTTKHEEQVAIALHALTALTKLWHHYNCPQDLLRTILMELHNLGTAPFESLKTWLNSASMNNIPGIGAARLNSKRYIEDLEANLKS